MLPRQPLVTIVLVIVGSMIRGLVYVSSFTRTRRTLLWQATYRARYTVRRAIVFVDHSGSQLEKETLGSDAQNLP